jgi:phosphate transport system substrate-binding protein
VKELRHARIFRRLSSVAVIFRFIRDAHFPKVLHVLFTNQEQSGNHRFIVFRHDAARKSARTGVCGMFIQRLSSTLLGVAFVISIAAAPAMAQSTLEVVGTGDGIDVLRSLGKAFSAENKSVFIDVPPSIGSGGGIAAVGSGKSVLGRVARKLTDTETASGLVYKPVALLPSAIFVNPNAGVKSVTTAQLANIFTGQIQNWKEVGGADMRIRVVRREDSDSTLIVLRASMPSWKDLAITEKSKMAMTTQEAIASVREVPGAVGWGPFSKDLETGLTVLKIDGKFPTDEGYPSNVTLALIYNKSTVTPEAKTFVEFCETKKAREIIARLGSVPAIR